MAAETPAARPPSDRLVARREAFDLPDGVVYLDGNSLGPLPRSVLPRLDAAVREHWGRSLIAGWNEHGWFDLPRRVGDRIGALVGAEPGSVVAADSTSINVAKVLHAALRMRPDRRVVVSDSGNFPTDLHMAQGLLRALDRGHELRVVAPEDVAGALGRDVAVLLLTQVDYRTARLHDMAALSGAAHEAGALTVWDLAHSAGALPVDLHGTRADFAVGCSYKYLNGGPGAPGFCYVAPRHQGAAEVLLSGWFGAAEPFAFAREHRPAPGIARMQVGTPPVLGLTALDAALDVWDDVDLAVLRRQSVALSEHFVAGVEQRCAAAGVRLASPRHPARRGSHVALRHPEGFAVVRALAAEGVIGDFRDPDLMRFGFAPLYLDEADVERAVETLVRVLEQRTWDRAEHRRRTRVT